MFWPRLALTPEETRRGAMKYFDYPTGRRGVLRKMYGGQLVLNGTIRQPIFTFQIARRCRVFGLTASGDIPQFKIQVQDSSGEQYVAMPVTLASLLGGYSEVPPPAYGAATAGAAGGFPPTVADVANTLGWAAPMGDPRTYTPLIFEPNIVLASNQALTITGFPMTDYDNVNYRIDLTLHVWEFPLWRNGPA